MPVTNIIDALRTYITTYAGLTTGAPLWVDYLGKEPTEYAIVPLPGPRIVETYLDGSTEREYPFAFEFVESTSDDVERKDNNAFAEAFADWLDSQTNADTFPTLETGKTATKIEALGWGYLLDESGSGTGVYQVQCKLTYDQEA